MQLFFSTLNQMAFLMIIIVVGYIISYKKIVPDNAAAVLSKIENTIFIPALVLGTFMNNFTINKLDVAWQFFLVGFVIIGLSIPVAIVVSKISSKDDYTQKIYTYGLAFSNFGFMGNAVVESLFPNIFMEYLIFVLPFWTMIYVWGVPTLLIPAQEKTDIKSRLSALFNPMFIAMIIGMIIGLINIPLPSFISSSVSALGSCMSPVAMLITGIIIAKINLKITFKNITLYSISAIRLLIIPLFTIIILKFIPISKDIAICIICSLAMPLGLNSIVVPAAYGKDTSVASGMALISHLFSCITIPVVFMIFNLVIS